MFQSVEIEVLKRRESRKFVLVDFYAVLDHHLCLGWRIQCGTYVFFVVSHAFCDGFLVWICRCEVEPFGWFVLRAHKGLSCEVTYDLRSCDLIQCRTVAISLSEFFLILFQGFPDVGNITESVIEIGQKNFLI